MNGFWKSLTEELNLPMIETKTLNTNQIRKVIVLI